MRQLGREAVPHSNNFQAGTITLTLGTRYPTMGAAVLAALCYYAYYQFNLSPPPRNFMADASAVAIGFVATAKSILLSVQNTTVRRHFKNGNQYRTLVDYFMQAIYWSFVVAGVSTAFLLFDPNQLNGWTCRFAIAAWVFLVFGATFSYLRVLRLFSLILTGDSA